MVYNACSVPMSRHSCDSRVGLRSTDQLISILSIECNRHVLHYFRESSEHVASLEEIADYVATRRDETGVSDPDRVAIRLHHSSLPKLAEVGIVDYDRRQHTVRYRGHSLVEEHLNLTVETDGEA